MTETTAPFDPGAEGWDEIAVGGFERRLGPFWQRRDPDGRLVVAILADDGHINRQGMVHGGVVLALADQGLGMAIYERTGGKRHATIQLEVHFVSAGRLGQLLECRATIDRYASGIVFVRGEIVAGDRLVATADGIWKVVEDRPARPGGEGGA